MAIDNKDMLDNIDKQIEELYVQRAEIENAIEQEKRETEKKKKEEKEKELTAIKNAIKAFNEKHDENYSLVKKIEMKAEDYPRDKHIPSDFTIEFGKEPLKTFSEYLESLLG